MKKQAEELITSARPRRSIEQNNRNYLKENKPHVYKKILQSKDKISRGESIPIIQFQCNYLDDSYFTDESISKNKNRETFITHWIGEKVICHKEILKSVIFVMEVLGFIILMKIHHQ